MKELILKLALDKQIELDLDDVTQTNHVTVMIHIDCRLPATGSLIQFGSLESVVIYYLPEAVENNDLKIVYFKEEEKWMEGC